jgi:hypothetical protein
MCAASPHRGLAECKGGIQLDAIAVTEPGGRDADDGVLAVAECDAAADDVLRTAEVAPPETVGQDSRRSCAPSRSSSVLKSRPIGMFTPKVRKKVDETSLA